MCPTDDVNIELECIGYLDILKIFLTVDLLCVEVGRREKTIVYGNEWMKSGDVIFLLSLDNCCQNYGIVDECLVRKELPEMKVCGEFDLRMIMMI